MRVAISRKLGEAAWRLRAMRLARLGSWLVTLSLVGLLVWRLLAWSHPAWPRGGVFVLIAAAIVISVLVAITSGPNRRGVARELDRRARTHDRFLSYLDLANQKDLPAAPLIEKDVDSFSAGLSLAGLFRPRLPRMALIGGAAALLGLGVLEHFHQQRQAALTTERAEANSILARAEAAIDRQSPDNQQAEELKRELKKTWEQVANSPDPKRDAYRALSTMEKNLASAAQAAALTSEEKTALAQSLSGDNAKLAQALQGGSDSEAAHQMAALDPTALAKALEDAARHRESARLRDLARQPQTQAQQMLVKSLRSSSAARRLQQALREAKAGENSPEQGDGQKTADQGMSTDAPPGPEKGQGGDLDQAPPSGDPGSEHDKGTGEDLGRERERVTDGSTQDEMLNSVTGGGPSRVASTELTGDGPGQATRATQSIDQAAIAAALQEVERENIPPGSQVLVRRYFESIRPRE